MQELLDSNLDVENLKYIYDTLIYYVFISNLLHAYLQLDNHYGQIHGLSSCKKGMRHVP